MKTRKPAFPHPPGACLLLVRLIVLALSMAGSAFAQSSTPTPSPSSSGNRQLEKWTTTGPTSLQDKIWHRAQVPDNVPTPITLADLLREENKRLKQRVETLEKENADLKAKLAGK
ncbi:MAG: hypothetical protein QOH88_3647 [Verrucomicrobiota bacterium]|jgi:hypothetical protein